MKKIWDVSHIEVIHAILNSEEYKQTLDEWAEVLYRYLSQLSDNQNSKVSETHTALEARTGTDE